MSEMMQAAQDNGLHVVPMSQKTCAMLRGASSPAILHVKSQYSATIYNHWVLFMGFDSQGARIYDGENFTHETCAALASRWDGTGLLISDREISGTPLISNMLGRFLSYAGLTLIAVGLLLSFQKRLPGIAATWGGAFRSSCYQAFGCLLLAVVVCGAFRLLHEEGFLSFREAVAGVQDFHHVQFLPRVTAAQAANELDRPKVVVIDARWKQDFELGHLPGSRNIEPNSTIEQCIQQMVDVPKDRKIIVYCSFDGCSYSGTVAEKLSKAGYDNCILFPGGWAEWEDYRGSVSEIDR